MAASSFEQALKYVLVDEGGNDDDPDDPGGRTSRGITQDEYNAWCALHHSPSGDVWKASDETVKAIYFQQYWLPFCPSLPVGLDYSYFDACVLEGPAEATKLLQRALGVGADGHWGVITALAVRECVPLDTLKKLSAAKLSFYRAIIQKRPRSRKYLHGWINRVNHVQANAEKLMGG